MSSTNTLGSSNINMWTIYIVHEIIAHGVHVNWKKRLKNALEIKEHKKYPVK